ncbi:MAG: hypothetical protein HOP33_08975 [Verrucomicrobia bacterium]|nr:hypothetical protein [Verrucomicrobiota bacterium]
MSAIKKLFHLALLIMASGGIATATPVYFPVLLMTGATNDVVINVRAVNNPVIYNGSVYYMPVNGTNLTTVGGNITNSFIPGSYTASIAGIPRSWRFYVTNSATPISVVNLMVGDGITVYNDGSPLGALTNRDTRAWTNLSSLWLNTFGKLVNGNDNIASGIGAHAEGVTTIASGDYAHAEGNSTVAAGAASHADGVLGAVTANWAYLWNGDNANPATNNTQSRFQVRAPGGILLEGVITGDGGGLTNLSGGTGGTFDYEALTNNPQSILNVQTNNAQSLTNIQGSAVVGAVSSATTATGVSSGTASLTGGSNTIVLTMQQFTMLMLAATNRSLLGASHAGLYVNYGAIVIGTNFTHGGAGGQIIVPNDFAIGDRNGNQITFHPSHSDQNTANPTDGLVIIDGGRDVDIRPGMDGTGQFGWSGGNKNDTFVLQYNQNVSGFSHKLSFRGISAANGASIIGKYNDTPGFVDLWFLANEPTFTPVFGEGFTSVPNVAFAIETGAASNSTFSVKKPIRELRSTGDGSTNIVVDFWSASQLLDVTPSATNVTVLLTNYWAGTTNFVRKTLYLRSGGNNLGVQWPTNLAVMTPFGTNGPATNINSGLMIRAVFENSGGSISNTIATVDTGADYSWAFDADAANFFLATGLSSAPQKMAVNNLITGMKNNGLWTKMQAVYPFVGGSSVTHAINAVNTNNFKITWSGTVTHDANGITGNGTTGYGDTAYTPGTSGAQNNAHYSFYCRTTSPSGMFLGVADGSGNKRVSMSTSAGNIPTRINNATATGSCQPSAGGDYRGFFVVSRSSSTAVATTSKGTELPCSLTSDGLATTTVTILADHWVGFAPDTWSTANCAFASIGTSLSTAEAAMLKTLVDKYETALGRNTP